MKHFKSSLLAFAVALLIISGSAFASFPTKKQTATEQTTARNNDANETAEAQFSKESVKSLSKNVAAEKPSADLDEKWILLILWFFLGFVAAHRWYAKKPIGWNILYIITLGGCGVWAIVDLVNILTDNF